jgi:hypothetical protein
VSRCSPLFGPSFFESNALPCHPAVSPQTSRFDTHRQPLRDLHMALPFSCCQHSLCSQDHVLSARVPLDEVHQCGVFFCASCDQGRWLWHLFPSRFFSSSLRHRFLPRCTRVLACIEARRQKTKLKEERYSYPVFCCCLAARTTRLTAS